MRGSPVVVVALLVACDGGGRWPGERPAAAPADADPATARRAGLAGCVAALTAPPSTALDGGLAALLATCTPCGVSWQPLLALSTTDPEDDAPGALPAPAEVLAILDACAASCAGSARSEVTALLRTAQLGKSPSAPWRKIGEACHGALRLDDRSRRFARGTWYALDQIARALWAADVPAEIAAARDARRLEFPLPPYSVASTALALPRAAHLDATAPRVHVTITADQVHVGGLPRAQLRDGAIALMPADQDYPGPEVALDDLAAAVAALPEAPALIAPRGLPARRLLDVMARLAAPLRLAATPRAPGAVAWPEPVGVIPVELVAAPPSPGVEPLELPAGATVGDLAAALDALAGRKVTRVSVRLAASP